MRMARYKRDPLSEWFDLAALGWLQRAYRHPGRWEVTYLAPPSRARRLQAAAELGEYDLDAVDRWGEIRWTRAFKRAVYHQHKLYGYAGGMRPGEPRAADIAATALRWETRGLLRKTGWPTRRRELALMIVMDTGAAVEAAAARPAAVRYDINPAYASRPPGDRPWDAE